MGDRSAAKARKGDACAINPNIYYKMKAAGGPAVSHRPPNAGTLGTGPDAALAAPMPGPRGYPTWADPRLMASGLSGVLQSAGEDCPLPCPGDERSSLCMVCQAARRTWEIKWEKLQLYMQ